MALRRSPSLPRRSRWLDSVLALAGGGSVVLGALGVPEGGLLIPTGALVACLPVLVVTMYLLRRTLPLVPFLVSAVLAAVAPTVGLALLFTAYAIGRYEPRSRVRLAAAAVGAVAVGQPWNIVQWPLLIGAVVTAAFTVLLPGAIGAWVRTRAELLAALRERAERAEAERELLARDAVLTERTRIAREMHDAVGHRVSLMVLQAGAIEMAADDRGRVEQLAEQVQVAGRQALDELRQAVGVLRSGEQDDAPLAPQPAGLEDLERLVAESQSVGVDARLRVAPALDVEPVTSRAAYRIVQESLTNVGKHAPGAAVRIDVEKRAGQLVVRVINGPGRAVDDAPGGGFGLVGLQERVRTLGGRLNAERRLDGGFEVEAVLPAGVGVREPASRESSWQPASTASAAAGSDT